MRILIGCETSGTIARAMRANGHYVETCDILPAQDPAADGFYHRQEDIFGGILSEAWGMVILHPPCTYLASSGQHWNHHIPGRAAQTEAGLQFVRDLIEVTKICPRVAIENPIGVLSTRLRKPDQIIQPYQFGDDASKATCLWLKGLPALMHTGYAAPRIVTRASDGRAMKRWANQTDSGQNRLPPSADRWQIRSNTYPGIARAMADQWAPKQPLDSH